MELIQDHDMKCWLKEEYVKKKKAVAEERRKKQMDSDADDKSEFTSV